LKKTVRKVIHIIPTGEQGEKSSWYLEVGKGGECSWPPDLDPPAHDLKIHNAMVGLLDL
jgi:hypothetical protein